MTSLAPNTFPDRNGTWVKAQTPNTRAFTPQRIVQTDLPKKDTQLRAHISFPMSYMASAVVNLQLGAPARSAVAITALDDAIKGARGLSKGEKGAYAVVDAGGRFELRPVKQPAIEKAQDPNRDEYVAFRPSERLQEAGSASGYEKQRITQAVQFLNRAVAAVVDGQMLIKNSGYRATKA